METLHAEGESPFVVRDDASVAAVISTMSDSDYNKDDENIQYANCPVDGCGEVLLLTEFDSHVRLHDVEDSDAELNLEDTPHKSQGAARDSGFGTKLSNALQHLDGGEEETQSISPQSNSNGSSVQRDDHKHSHESSQQTTHGGSIRQERAKAIWKQVMNMPEVPSKAHLSSSAVKSPKKRLAVCMI